MILCVYAMWNQSKRILYILLFTYVPQVIVSFVFTGVYDNPNTYLSGMSGLWSVTACLVVCSHASLPLFPPVTAIQVINFSLCSALFSNVALILSTHWIDGILRFILSVTIFILAAIQTLKQSVGMYKATKQWQLNQYMHQLMGDGILYFLMYASSFHFFHFHSLPLYCLMMLLSHKY